MANLSRYAIAAVLVASSGVASLAWNTSPAVAGDSTDLSHVPGAKELEGRLIAPCCWTQTLDIHDSPIADELRREISRRLHAGEAAIAIEDDLAQRFGENIRAVPRGRDPRTNLPLFLSIAMALSVLALIWAARRWLKRSGPVANGTTVQSAANNAEGLEYDAQLDAELKRSTE